MYYSLINSMNRVAPSNPLWDGLKAYYTADSTSNDALATHNGTLTNGATYTTGKINNGFSFDGVNDYVAVSPTFGASFTAPSSTHTYSAWIYPTILGSLNTIVSNGSTGAGANGTIFCLYNGFIAMYYRGGNSLYASTTTYSINTWTHFVLTFNAGVVKIYKNGVLDSTSGTLTWTDGGNPTNTFIGAWKSDAGFFKGIIDEIGAWTRVLTATEVTELYNSGSGKQYPL
jgi:hypothetical protein